MSTTVKERIHLLHQSPLTPLFLLKTKHEEQFDVHKDSPFLAPHLREMFVRINKASPFILKKKIQLKDVVFPDLGFALEIPRDGNFSNFIPRHQVIASKLTKLFMSIKSLDDLTSVIAFVRDRINPSLYFYSLAVAMAHRSDIKDSTGDILNAFPMNFITTSALTQARNQRAVGVYSSLLNPIEIPETGTFLDEEYRVAFFREDLAANSHHWYWHIVYPNEGDIELVKKDRRGELFFYMHQQMIGRYNMERLCVNLPRVVSFNNFRDPIAQGHYPKLRAANSSTDIPGRPANIPWHDLDHISDRDAVKISDMMAFRLRIEQAIDTGSVVMDQEGVTAEKDGTRIIRHKDLTIDMLGNMVEASLLSPNPIIYGNLHNNGHILTASAHDPEKKYLEHMGVMGDTATAIRDPFFFRWHGLMDDIFQRFKTSKRSPPYGSTDLLYPDIAVKSVEMFEDPLFYKNVLTPAQVEMINKGFKEGVAQREFHTYWMKTVIKVDGLDFQMDKPMYINYKHLDHVPFTYRIQVNNTKEARKGTVRIFLAPTVDENGAVFKLKEQRRLFVEMDRFVVDLNSGLNTITRKSTESSVTIPLEQSFPESLVTTKEQKSMDMYCRCGWPQHLLLPRGMMTGAKFQLFVMVSDYEKDKVAITPTGMCKESSSFCGLKDNKYPDARSMGYPFDRAVDESQYQYVADFVAKNGNMILTDVQVKFTEIIVDDPRSKTN